VNNFGVGIVGVLFLPNKLTAFARAAV